MSNASNSSSELSAPSSSMAVVEQYVKFYFFLIFHIPSLLCTVFIFFHFKWNRLVNHIFGILLILNTLLILVELPFNLVYLHQGFVSNLTVCPIWILINYTLFILSIILITWASIERYFFIYHEQFINRYRIGMHYIPIGFFIIYTPLFYIAVVLFYPCEQAYDLTRYLCNGPCYLLHAVPSLIDWCANVLAVLVITSFMNIFLIICTMNQRHRMKQAIITAGNSQQWRRTIKLSVQLFSISSLCMIGWVPYGVLSTMQMIRYTDFAGYLLATYFIYFPYAQTLFLPYTCLLFMPNIRRKFIEALYRTWIVKKCFPNNRIHVADGLENGSMTLTNQLTLNHRNPSRVNTI